MNATKAKCSPSSWSRYTRMTLMLLTLASTALGTWIFVRLIARDGMSLADYPLAALFAILFLWVVFSFWTATMGLIAKLRGDQTRLASSATDADAGELPRTAILMPVYNEDPISVFAGLRAMIRSLHETGHGKFFDVFVLSDTTDPDIWLEEEHTWAKLVAELTFDSRVFYRHRAKNLARKSGNIADFCTRWGDHYPYMVVLDADSVMDGATVVEMVRRMERDPEIGILQVPPTPVNRQSVFARMQQFAARVYGPVFVEGFALWSQHDGNYWGHNAIIRIHPFIEHCDLPILPGEGPLGGEILSHDFVEAALMRRAGWKVCLAHDLDGSYEECPTTILDFAQRDQRWCQGNLQHIKLLLADGFHLASRLHLSMGVMAYVASPLWLLFLILSILGALIEGKWFATGASAAAGVMLFVATMAMLLLPKLWGVIALSQQPQRVDGHGGWWGATASVLVETSISVLVAPIMMLLHSYFVVSTLVGHKVSWNAQSRDDRGVSLRDAIAVHYPHTLIGLAVSLGLWRWAPGLLPWMSPVLLGMVVSIPLSMFLGSVNLGKRMAAWKLFVTPEEIARPAVLQWQREALAAARSDRSKLFASVLYDPAFYALHVGILRATECHVPVSAEQLEGVLETLRSSDAKAVSPADRRAVLNDARALERLHIHARSHLSPARSILLA
jgi:membrane glycosyltransferase